MSGELWCESYRPQHWRDLLQVNEQNSLSKVSESIASLQNKGSDFHLLLSGPCGTGKTSIAACMANAHRELWGPESVLVVNASDVRGMLAIHQQVLTFSKSLASGWQSDDENDHHNDNTLHNNNHHHQRHAVRVGAITTPTPDLADWRWSNHAHPYKAAEIVEHRPAQENQKESMVSFKNSHCSSSRFQTSTQTRGLVVCDEVDGMTNEGQRALASLLEESNNGEHRRVQFVLLCNDLHRILTLIKSHCLLFVVTPLSIVEMTSLLQSVLEKHIRKITSEVEKPYPDPQEKDPRMRGGRDGSNPSLRDEEWAWSRPPLPRINSCQFFHTLWQNTCPKIAKESQGDIRMAISLLQHAYALTLDVTNHQTDQTDQSDRGGLALLSADRSIPSLRDEEGAWSRPPLQTDNQQPMSKFLSEERIQQPMGEFLSKEQISEKMKDAVEKREISTPQQKKQKTKPTTNITTKDSNASLSVHNITNGPNNNSVLQQALDPDAKAGVSVTTPTSQFSDRGWSCHAHPYAKEKTSTLNKGVIKETVSSLSPSSSSSASCSCLFVCNSSHPWFLAMKQAILHSETKTEAITKCQELVDKIWNSGYGWNELVELLSYLLVSETEQCPPQQGHSEFQVLKVDWLSQKMNLITQYLSIEKSTVQTRLQAYALLFKLI